MRIEYIMERSDHKIVESNFNQIVGPADVLELAGNILENYYNGLIMIKRSSGKKKKTESIKQGTGQGQIQWNFTQVRESLLSNSN
jgi:hypothetical protein